MITLTWVFDQKIQTDTDIFYKRAGASGVFTLAAGNSVTIDVSALYVFTEDAAGTIFLAAATRYNDYTNAHALYKSETEIVESYYSDKKTMICSPVIPAVSLSINNGNNLKKVTVGETEYTNFPASVSVSDGAAITGYGKDSPVITVDYLNTQEPVITDS